MSQIPALVISTSAGIIVTRVASEEEGGHLGRDIGLQVMAQPKAIAIAAGLLLLLAIVPGLPRRPVPHAGGGAGLRRLAAAARAGGGAERRGSGRRDRGGAARARRAAARRRRRAVPGADADRRRGLGRAGRADRPRGAGDAGSFVTEVVPRMRERLFAELGLPLPVVRLRPGRRGPRPRRAFVIRLNEVPLGRGDIPRDAWDGRGARLGDEVLALRPPLRPRAVRPGGDAGAPRRAGADPPGAGARGGAEADLAGAADRRPAPPGRGRDLAAQPARHPGRAGRVGAAGARSGRADRARARRAPPRHHLQARGRQRRARRLPARSDDRGRDPRRRPEDRRPAATWRSSRRSRATSSPPSAARWARRARTAPCC